VSWVEVFAVFVVSHLVGDFLIQTEWQASHKLGGLGGSPAARRALLAHLATYTLCFLPALIWLGGSLAIAISIPPDSASAAAVDADPALFQRLREWRSAVARTEGIAAFMVFHDKTLSELASRRPADMSQLEAVPGIGPSKLDRYGEALLQILAT